MGRHINGGFDYKFWFGVQPSDDIKLFGGCDASEPAWLWSQEDIPFIKEKLKTLKIEFKKKFKMTYRVFMNKIKQKGYLSSSADAETNTGLWNDMSKLAATIDLGTHIKLALENEDYINVDYEE